VIRDGPRCWRSKRGSCIKNGVQGSRCGGKDNDGNVFTVDKLFEEDFFAWDGIA